MSIGRKGMLYAARCMAEGTKLWMERRRTKEQAVQMKIKKEE